MGAASTPIQPKYAPETDSLLFWFPAGRTHDKVVALLDEVGYRYSRSGRHLIRVGVDDETRLTLLRQLPLVLTLYEQTKSKIVGETASDAPGVSDLYRFERLDRVINFPHAVLRRLTGLRGKGGHRRPIGTPLHLQRVSIACAQTCPRPGASIVTSVTRGLVDRHILPSSGVAVWLADDASFHRLTFVLDGYGYEYSPITQGLVRIDLPPLAAMPLLIRLRDNLPAEDLSSARVMYVNEADDADGPVPLCVLPLDRFIHNTVDAYLMASAPGPSGRSEAVAKTDDRVVPLTRKKPEESTVLPSRRDRKLAYLALSRQRGTA